MQVLMHKSHDLLKEEIILAAFHMANVDFGTVHVLTEQFLPSNFLVRFTVAFYWYTLDSGINIGVRLLIFGFFSGGYVLIQETNP